MTETQYKIPTIGSMWLHENGTTYTVFALLNTDANPVRAEDYPVIVAYRGPDGRTWGRLHEQWKKTVMSGRLKPIQGTGNGA